MQLLSWFAGVLALCIGFKFIFLVFKRLGNTDSMNNILDKAEGEMANAADSVAGYIKKKKFRKKEEEQPIVTIR